MDRPRAGTFISIAAIAVVAAALLAGCGSSSSSSSSSSASKTTSTTASQSPAAEQAQIKQAWLEFFAASTPASTKVSLLQNGQQFSSVIKAEAKSPLAQQVKAQVSSVTLTSANTASVKYTILLAGTPALKNRTGTAIKTGGRWKVALASFCQLLTLQGTAPPGCPKG